MKRTRWLLILIIILLGILAFLFAIGRIEGDTDTPDPPLESDIQSEQQPEPQKEYITVAVDELKENAETSSNMWEFLQRFFPDHIVYKTSSGKFAYEPVDRTLPLSDYDWSNLVEVGLDSREVEYVENGQTVSIKGIDVSRYQEEIDWEKVAASGVRYAFIRLGYRGYSSGKLVLDERFDENIRGALDNGIDVGVYFVTQAVSVEEAEEEAEFVLENIKDRNVTWPVVLDVEDTASEEARTQLLTSTQRTDYVCAFCDRIMDAGKVPMIYANIRWFIEKMEISRLTEYDKWFAQYFNRPFFPYAFQVWQYTNTGKVDGIKGNVDLNISFRDYSSGE